MFDLHLVVAAALARLGLHETASRLDIPEESVLRIATRQTVRSVTTRLAMANVSRLDGEAHAP